MVQTELVVNKGTTRLEDARFKIQLLEVMCQCLKAAKKVMGGAMPFTTSMCGMPCLDAQNGILVDVDPKQIDVP